VLDTQARHNGCVPLRRLLLVLALYSIAILAAACFGDEDDEPSGSPTPAGAIATQTPAPEVTSTPRPSVSPSPGPSPTAGGGIEYNGFRLFGDFTYADPIDFPENLMLLIETGCTQCDGPTEALYRVWRNSGGTHVEKLLDATISDFEDAYITSFALKPDLSDVVVGVCTASHCGGVGPQAPDSRITFYRSQDGGVTWTPIHTTSLGGVEIVRAITPDGIVVERIQDGTFYYLGGVEVVPPEDADGLSYETRRAGMLQWQAAGGSELIDAAGATIAVVEPGGFIGSAAFELGEASPRPVVGWREDGQAETGWHITRMRDDFSLAGFHATEYVLPAVILSDSSVLGLMTLPGSLIGGTVGFIDIERGVLTPFGGRLLDEPFGDGQTARGRNALQAAVEGPFLRVTTTTPCVNIRAGTTGESEELTCALDGVLVHDLGTTVTVGQQTLRHVRLLDGREGYIPAEVVTPD
jgi:hypothetical protein